MLIQECELKIHSLTKELEEIKILLRNCNSDDTFLLYITQLETMALSLETLLTNRRTNKNNLKSNSRLQRFQLFPQHLNQSCNTNNHNVNTHVNDFDLI